ncbi:xylulokinase [Microbacterium sp. MPKO10]|uniref:xylulokinase n=1 Tax=Microbacterium sp. MPKO10 TaxID=2989818 RepID=UPI0022359BD4|nr:FGGY family carbohydrate kinase [Microbacterium sp. MPKO10]MCW4459258.1 FGGY family carbohydrate kinase [Microbacterium sp. MPKO10]
MTLVAGIDSSTQSCKVVVREATTGAVVRRGRAAHPDGTAVDPEAWLSALHTAVSEAGGLDDVSAISVAAQQHGMVALDAEGEVVRDALLWNDTRSAPQAIDLIDELGGTAEYARRAGVVPVASFTATKLRWLRDAEPENAARVAAVALPHDWLSWRMRGFGPRRSSEFGPNLDELTTDRSDASGTAYWSPTTGDYDRDLLTLALGHDAVLPRVLDPQERAGIGADAFRNTVIAAGAGDNAGAALGLDAGVGDVVISIGTSGTVFAVTPDPVVDPSGTVAGFADAAGRFLPLVATLNAARVLDTVAGLLGVSHGELADLSLQAEPGSRGLVLQPYFEGERTPNLPDATASLFGMTMASTTRENLARAAVEGMLCALAAGVDAVEKHGVTAERLLLVGGAAQNTAVQTVASQVFRRPIVVPTPGEYVADGAARQAAWALHGERPTWPLQIAAQPASDYRPVIMQQYDARRID